MIEFFSRLLVSSFMPHGHCFFWRPEIVWLHVVSDGLTAAAYFLIPFALFGLFILACGTSHVMSIFTLWIPVYRLEGVIKALTAFASVPTALLMIRLLPQAVALPSPGQLEEVNRESRRKSSESRQPEVSRPHPSIFLNVL